MVLGQFVLLVWATDVIQKWLKNKSPTPKNIFNVIGKQPKIRKSPAAGTRHRDPYNNTGGILYENVSNSRRLECCWFPK